MKLFKFFLLNKLIIYTATYVIYYKMQHDAEELEI
jgi:hypothetical protein